MTLIPMAEALSKIEARKGLKPSKNGSLTVYENKFLESVGAPRLRNCTDEAISQALKYGMILLGIRENNLPNELEKTLLINTCRDHHPTLTIKELKLAFEMASAFQLDFDPKSYQHFSVIYLNELLQSYKAWANKTYRNLRPDSLKEDEKESFTWSPMVFERQSVNNHRAQIQKGLEHFREGVLSQPAYIPYEWYMTLVEDGFIEYDENAVLTWNKKASDLSAIEKQKLTLSQKYVWQLFESAGKRNLYEPDNGKVS